MSANKTLLAIAALLAAILGGLLLFSRKSRKKSAVTDENPAIESEIRKGKAAMRRLILRAVRTEREGGRTQGEDAIVRNAMQVPGIGPIDFVWGRFSRSRGTGNAAKKIIGAMKLKRDYHCDTRYTPRMIYQVPEILMRGKSYIGVCGRLVVETDCHKVILEKGSPSNQGSQWVFNAYPELPIPAGKAKRTRDVAQAMKAKRNGPVS